MNSRISSDTETIDVFRHSRVNSYLVFVDLPMKLFVFIVFCYFGTTEIHANENRVAKLENALQGNAIAAEVDALNIRLDETHGHLLVVPFPLAEVDDRRVRLQIQQILERHVGQSRPVVVLKFVEKGQSVSVMDERASIAIGRGTEFERSLSLARWLVGPVGVRARTIAYLPDSIEGHATLVALGCEEIAMAPLAEMGRASVDEASVDDVVTDGYLGITQRRGAFPAEAVRSMLDQDAPLYRVELVGENSRFVSEKDLDQLRQKNEIVSETQISIPGQLGKFTGQEMRSWRWITHLARDEDHLREILATTTWKVEKKVVQSGSVKPALIELRGAVSQTSVNRWLRAIDEARNTDIANLLILHIHSPGGDLAASLQMAEYLAKLDDTAIETVAWVDGEARGDAALIALACDSLLLKPASIFGGPGEATIEAATIRKMSNSWQELAKLTNRTEGEIYGMLCSELDIHEFLDQRGRTEIGDTEIFSQRADFKNWKKGRAIAFPKGVTAEEAVQRNWAIALSPNLLAVADQWGLEKLPEPKRVSKLEKWIRSLADQDWLATILLTLALILFTNELSTPGVGLPGFFSFVCIAFFFWMKFLEGTVEWLEITLCVCGMLALGLEIFVLPGFGIFGFGGFIMLASGVILASQTFIIPSNEYQWGRLALSTGQIAIACVGLITTLYLLRNQLEKMPFFRMLKLDPPPAEIDRQRADDRSFLVGATGVTTSRCAPQGKAMIEDQYWDVLSHDELLDPNTPIRVTSVQDRMIFVHRVSS